MKATSTFFAGAADGYEIQMGRWSRSLAPLLIGFAGPAAGRMLDVGCGTGNLALALAGDPSFDAIAGVDLSAEYVTHARTRTADPRVSFHVGDACALPFPDRAFDQALSSLVLQFVPDAVRAVREMRRVTRPGGTVAAATWDSRGGLVAYRMFLDTAALVDQRARALRATTCMRPLSQVSGLSRAWVAAGLDGVETTAATIRMQYLAFDDYWQSLDGANGPYAEYLAGLDANTKGRLRECVADAYLDGDGDGPRSYAATAWLVKGIVPQAAGPVGES